MVPPPHKVTPIRQARFFTINAASDVLERDRRTIAKALRDVRPDMKDEQHRERWKLSTIVHALSQLDRAGVAATTHDERSILDELKRLGDALQRGLERLGRAQRREAPRDAA